jgi:hypothetical protein
VRLEENQEQQLQQLPDLATNADGHGRRAGERGRGEVAKTLPMPSTVTARPRLRIHATHPDADVV